MIVINIVSWLSPYSSHGEDSGPIPSESQGFDIGTSKREPRSDGVGELHSQWDFLSHPSRRLILRRD